MVDAIVPLEEGPKPGLGEMEVWAVEGLGVAMFPRDIYLGCRARREVLNITSMGRACNRLLHIPIAAILISN